MSTYLSNLPSTTAPKASPLDKVQKVVVVNSSPEILTLAERALTAGHYDVVFVESIAHAYSQIRRVRPNLVILSLRTSDRDGFQLLSMLKLDPDTRHVPILTYTAEDLPESEESAESESDDAEEDGFFSTVAPSQMN